MERTTSDATIRILVALSIAHCMNDTLQSVVTALYPMLKNDLALTFGQIGIIALVYQMSASVFQPVVGFWFDKHPVPWSLPLAISFTLAGLLSMAFSTTLPAVIASVFLIGLGSSTLHPEAARLTSIASGSRRGLGQSLFQVGGNIGGSLGPLLVALLVAPYGRENLAGFALIAAVGVVSMIPISRWYRKRLRLMRAGRASAGSVAALHPLSRSLTIVSLVILLILVFSKYVYAASLGSFYTFYLMEKFGLTIKNSQLLLFVFGLSTAIGTLIGGPIGDRIGRKRVIWGSILGAAPFAILMPHANLLWTVILTFCTGAVISSAFPAIIVYAQELLPNKLGLISGLFYGFAFGIAGIASAILGRLTDSYGIEAIYNVCAWMPLIGIVAWGLPDIRKKKRE
ncbi:MAG: MFS transporter [Tannerellaceae bacterium]|jgi:FSR family fosmidomycin resistance protein-like MFS transporter|nr:MFS transporter [Tannerellaceae bacterium]